MILSKHACGHTTHVPTMLRRSFLVHNSLEAIPKRTARGRNATMTGGVVRGQQIGPSIRRTKKNENSCIRVEKVLPLSGLRAFSSHIECVSLRDVLCHELSLLRPTDKSLDDESRAGTAAACYWKLMDGTDRDEKRIILHTWICNLNSARLLFRSIWRIQNCKIIIFLSVRQSSYILFAPAFLRYMQIMCAQII